MTTIPKITFDGFDAYKSIDTRGVGSSLLSHRGKFSFKIPSGKIQQAKEKEGRTERNWMYALPLECLDADNAGRVIVTYVTFTGRIGSGKKAGQPNAAVFLAPFLESAGLTVDEIKAMSGGSQDPEKLLGMLIGRTVYGDVDVEAEKTTGRFTSRFSAITKAAYDRAVAAGTHRTALPPAAQLQYDGVSNGAVGAVEVPTIDVAGL